MAKEKEEERAWAPEVIDMLSRMSVEDIDDDIKYHREMIPVLEKMREAVYLYRASNGHEQIAYNLSALFPEEQAAEISQPVPSKLSPASSSWRWC